VGVGGALQSLQSGGCRLLVGATLVGFPEAGAWKESLGAVKRNI
jgi:hypothetical protein